MSGIGLWSKNLGRLSVVGWTTSSTTSSQTVEAQGLKAQNVKNLQNGQILIQYDPIHANRIPIGSCAPLFQNKSVQHRAVWPVLCLIERSHRLMWSPAMGTKWCDMEPHAISEWETWEENAWRCGAQSWLLTNLDKMVTGGHIAAEFAPWRISASSPALHIS